MELSELIKLWPYALCGVVCAAAGSWVTSRTGRVRRRQLQQRVAECELALLDARADTQRLERMTALDAKREKVLGMAMARFSASETRYSELESKAASERAQHEVESARLNAAVADSRNLARTAALAARKSASNLKRLQTETLVVQTSSEPLFEMNGSRVSNGLEQTAMDGRCETITPVGHSDSARLSRLRSSNETSLNVSDDLQSIKGISPALEQRLKAAGIHRVEQLANLSDSEADELDRRLASSDDAGRGATLQSDARQLLEQLPVS